MTGDLEFPDGLTVDDLSRWPFSGAELYEGCPHWSGGPYDASDVERAERVLRGWRALVGPEGFGLVLVRPGSPQEAFWAASRYARLG